jgi:hypothetical protein
MSAQLPAPTAGGGAFWDDLDRDMQDPEFRHHFLLQSQRIAATDASLRQQV